MSEFSVALFEDCQDRVVENLPTTFAKFVDLLRELAASPQERRLKEKTVAFIPATFDPLWRKKVNVTFRHAFALDADGDRPGDPGFDGMAALLDQLGFAYCIHTTTKSTVGQNRYRVILPCVPVATADYEAACCSLDQMLSNGEGVFDRKTFDASRLSFAPQAWHGAPSNSPDWNEAEAHVDFRARVDGEWIDAATVMAAFPPLPREEDATSDFDTAAWLASRPVTSVHDHWTLCDLDRSPLVTEAMQTEYMLATEGGRYFRFLCRVASRALFKNLPCEAEVIHALGEAMNQRGSHSKRRSIREARRAVQWAVANHAPKSAPVRPSHSELHAAITQLKRKNIKK